MISRVRLFAVLLSLMLCPSAHAASAGETTTVCFTLAGADCAQPILGEIAGARQTIRVQAYNFSEPRIIGALIAAHARGVDVVVILDKTSPYQRGEGADSVRAAGIPTYIDYRPKIAHNKVMVIDGGTVITGSLNFTAAAVASNAENSLIIHDAALAAAYAGNFAQRLAASRVF
jgi:phosphatidylserine/phosphatidylglycerophosphate/cardiolipin synthase-like enzyme